MSRGRRRRPRSRFRKLVELAVTAVLFAVLAAVAARFERVSSRLFEGAVRVSDGDSLVLAGERIRLWGIDAPELNQVCRRQGTEYRCGEAARDALLALVGGERVSCEGWERDRYDRLLAVCTARTVELNRAQVEAGWAVAWGGYSGEERGAEAARRGLWAGEFDRPRDWRARHGDPIDPSHDPLPRFLNWLRQLFRIG
jgi:endonuclease YncB( thermonuclease family)